MRVYQANAPENLGAVRLENYLAQAMPLLPARVIRDAFQKRDVKMNGVRAGKDAPVLPGAKIQLYTPFEIQLPVVYEDENILIINKPAGISSDDDGRGGMTVESLLQKENGYPRLCHRLDNATCGLLLLCKNSESEEILLEDFKERRMEKRYECLVRGEMRPPAATREAYLIKDAGNAKVRVITHGTPGALPIATQYETISFDGTISRLRVTLLTGRTHQIRAHMSFLSHPLLGDDKYGDRALNKRLKASSLKLCACELVLHPGGKLSYLDGKMFSIPAPF